MSRVGARGLGESASNPPADHSNCVCTRHTLPEGDEYLLLQHELPRRRRRRRRTLSISDAHCTHTPRGATIVDGWLPLPPLARLASSYTPRSSTAAALRARQPNSRPFRSRDCVHSLEVKRASERCESGRAGEWQSASCSDLEPGFLCFLLRLLSPLPPSPRCHFFSNRSTSEPFHSVSDAAAECARALRRPSTTDRTPSPSRRIPNTIHCRIAVSPTTGQRPGSPGSRSRPSRPCPGRPARALSA